MNRRLTQKTPWHLWAIGVVSLLWHAGGAYDYTMTNMRNEAYLDMAAQGSGVPVQVIVDYFTSFPIWAHAAWAFGVWGALVGSILLLLRSRYAVVAFVVSLIGLAVTSIYTFGGNLPPELASAQNTIFTIAVMLVLLGLMLYSRAMVRRGVLR